MPDKFKSLTEILSKDRAFENFRKSVNEQDVINEFSKIFPDLKKTVTANNVHKGILYLVVENSVLRNEIYLNKSVVIEKINTYFNHSLIKDIKFTNFRNIYRIKK